MRVTFLSPALAEIIAAIEYYDSQRSGLGAELDSDLERTLTSIVENPGLGAPFEGDNRRALLHRFPYSVVYRLLVDRVLVVAFTHLRRRPEYWRDRL